MNKKIFISLIIAAVIIVIAAGGLGYWYYQKLKNAGLAQYNALNQAGQAAEDLGKQASQGVLPSIDPGSNPLEKVPDINPVSKTNPFSEIKINPFE
ncbi:MAG: hypothetical protein Q8M83_04720 [bacterium]|nr:hypothetical protein [bacterium]